MFSVLSRRPFRFPDSTDDFQTERAIASVRIFLSACGGFAIYLDSSEPAYFANLAYSLLLTHFTYSLILFVHARLRAVSQKAQVAIHLTDVLWAVVLTLFSRGTSSLFFVFFVFALVAAAYRWYLRETIITAALLVALLDVEGYLMVTVQAFGKGQEFELNRLIVRFAYLLGIAVLVGVLAEREKIEHGKTIAVSRVVGSLHGEMGLDAASSLQPWRPRGSVCLRAAVRIVRCGAVYKSSRPVLAPNLPICAP